jgi:hypothetical protein
MRREFQRSEAPTAVLARKYGVNPKTVAKWRRRKGVAELAKGPKRPASTVLSADDEALIVAFRKLTRLPLDVCWNGLRPMIPTLSRSALHRCLKRWRISRVPKSLREPPPPIDPTNDPWHFDLELYRFQAPTGQRHLLLATSPLRTHVFARCAAAADAEFVATFVCELALWSPVAVAWIAAPSYVYFARSGKPDAAAAEATKRSAFAIECRQRKITPLSTPGAGGAPRLIVAGWSDVVTAQRRPRAKTRSPRRR